MNAVITEAPFAPQTKACAQCAHWSGARRVVRSGAGVVVMADVSDERRARCGVSSMARTASEACSRFQPAFN